MTEQFSYGLELPWLQIRTEYIGKMMHRIKYSFSPVGMAISNTSDSSLPSKNAYTVTELNWKVLGMQA
jgi:hypothetical protein